MNLQKFLYLVWLTKKIMAIGRGPPKSRKTAGPLRIAPLNHRPRCHCSSLKFLRIINRRICWHDLAVFYLVKLHASGQLYLQLQDLVWNLLKENPKLADKTADTLVTLGTFFLCSNFHRTSFGEKNTKNSTKAVQKHLLVNTSSLFALTCPKFLKKCFSSKILAV